MGERNLEGYLVGVIGGSIMIAAAFVLARTNIPERYIIWIIFQHSCLVMVWLR